jgi:hypothetical protein
VRGHQSSTLTAPGDDCGGHHLGKAATAPLTSGEREGTSLPQFWHRGDNCGGHHSLLLEHLLRGHQSRTKFRHQGMIVVCITRGKQQLHLEHLVRGHQSSAVPAPGGVSGTTR